MMAFDGASRVDGPHGRVDGRFEGNRFVCPWFDARYDALKPRVDPETDEKLFSELVEDARRDLERYRQERDAAIRATVANVVARDPETLAGFATDPPGSKASWRKLMTAHGATAHGSGSGSDPGDGSDPAFQFTDPPAYARDAIPKLAREFEHLARLHDTYIPTPEGAAIRRLSTATHPSFWRKVFTRSHDIATHVPTANDIAERNKRIMRRRRP